MEKEKITILTSGDIELCAEISFSVDFPCIYKIENLITGDFYIGSASNGNRRFCVHLSKLKGNKHNNYRLQRAWNKYGGSNFLFTIIEEFDKIDREDLFEIEQFYIDTQKPRYNLTLIVSSFPREIIDFLAEQNSKEFIITDKNGKEFVIKGLARFCRENNINEDGLRAVVKGTISNHSGWKARRANEKKQKYIVKNIKYFLIIFPDGAEYVTDSLKKFCNENNLGFKHMLNISMGFQKQHKNFRCIKMFEEILPNE